MKLSTVKHHSIFNILIILVLLLSAACSANPRKIITIGMLNLSPALEPGLIGFKERMTELGYIEGQTIRYVYQGPTGTVDKLKPAAEALMGPEIDLIVAISTPGIAILKEITQGTDKQVLFISIFDPLSSGFVDSNSRPGGNLTGSRGGVIEPKRLEWLTRLAPRIKKLYAPFSPNDGASKLDRAMLIPAAQKLGIEFIFKEVANGDAISQAAKDIPADADAIFILQDSQIVARLPEFVAASLKHKLPLAAPNSNHVQSGALISYGFDFKAAGRQIARMADQMLKGVKAADMPVEASEFFLAINIATANAIDLEISDSLLQRADLIFRELPADKTAEPALPTPKATETL